MRLIAEMYEYCLEAIPKWNASNICCYHLQEAGATPVQELAFALANAISLLDLLKTRGKFSTDQFERAVGRISFFVNAGIRFIEEMSKMRAFGAVVGLLHRRPVRRHESEVPDVPLRRTGQLAGPDRGAAREQRLAHPDRGARRDPVPQRPLPRPAVARLERGDESAAAVGPAVVPAAAADPGLRDRPAGVPGSVRRLAGHRIEGGGACGRGQCRDRDDPRHGRRHPRDRVRLHEDRPGAIDVAADEPHQCRRADRRRAEQVDRWTALSPDLGRGRRDLPGRPKGDANHPRLAGRHARESGCAAGRGRAVGAEVRGEGRFEPDGALDRVRAGPRDDRRVGGCAARGVRRVPPGDRDRRPTARALG